jgi:hypothetical protein
MILLNLYTPKKSYSQEREDRRQAEKQILQAKKDQLQPDYNISLCCKASITTVEQPNAMENEVSRIRVCDACLSEIPKLGMFQEINKVADFFIQLHSHKSENN